MRCITSLPTRPSSSTTPRFTNQYAPVEGPVLELVVTARRRDGSQSQATVIACVDSGAARSYLPLAVAEELGIRDLLVENDALSAGLGSTFPTWAALELRPWFGEPADLLLGRADFFQPFRITFDENPVAPLLHLEW